MHLANDNLPRLGPPTAPRVRLLIAEKGAEVLGSHLSPADCEEVVVLRQFEPESPVELFLRAFSKIAHLECSGKQVGRAVLVMAPLLEPELVEARRMLSCTILSHAQRIRAQSELVLAVDAHASADLRQQMNVLVDSLAAHPGSRYAPIRVRFGSRNECVSR